MTEQITKIKVNNDGTATINFKTTGDLDTKEITFSGKEKITDEFDKEFQNAVNSFVEIIPALKDDKNKITMNAITFGYGEGEKIDKVSYTVKYKPQESVLANIPINNVPIYKDTFTEKTFAVSGKDEKLLYSILDYASKYIQGETKTKQGKCVKTDKDGNVVIDFSNKE